MTAETPSLPLENIVMRVSEAFGAVVELALATGATNINSLPGCWEHQIDEQWWVAVNGRPSEVACSKGIKVPPFHVYVEFNGWPAGLLAPSGGTIAAGAAANEGTFIAACEAARGPAGADHA